MITASSIAVMSINVRLVVSALEKSALAAASPAIRLLTCSRKRRSNSAITLPRSASSAERAVRKWCASSRTSERLARSISMSPMRSSIAEKDNNKRWIARSRQSPRILVSSRGCGRRAAGCVVAAFMP